MKQKTAVGVSNLSSNLRRKCRKTFPKDLEYHSSRTNETEK